MRRFHYLALLKSVLVLLMVFDFTCAQYDDEALDPVTQEKCVPDSQIADYSQFIFSGAELIDIRKWYSFGSEYYKNGDYHSALPYLWKVFLNDSSKRSSNAIAKISDSYFRLQFADSTLNACYLGLEKFPESSKLHYYAGLLQESKGMYRCAIPHYEKLVEQSPKEESYLDKLAFFYLKNEDERCIETQERLVKLDPANPEYLERLANYQEHFGINILETLRSAHKNNPSDMVTALRLGRTELNEGRYKDAILTLSKIIDIDKANIDALLLRAQSKENLEDYLGAVSDYKEILKSRENDADIMCSIADDYKLLNRYKNAVYWIKKAKEARPGYGLPYITMAEIYEHSVPYCQEQEKRGRKIDDGIVYEKAAMEYEKAKKDPQFTALANKRIKQITSLFCTQEELFFAQGKKIIKKDCYKEWIK